MLTLYDQRNPLWANNKLGATNLTIGEDGCNITAQCILASAFGKMITPDEVAKHPECFDANGEYLYNYPDFPFTLGQKITGRNDVAIRASLKDPKRCVMLNVDRGAHFIATLKRNYFGSYTCADPWWGDKCDAIRRWHDITGSRHFILK